jgi:hypothetical protein
MTAERRQARTMTPPVGPYEAPRVERSLAPTELEREVHYAGANSTGPAIPVGDTAP